MQESWQFLFWKPQLPKSPSLRVAVYSGMGLLSNCWILFACPAVLSCTACSNLVYTFHQKGNWVKSCLGWVFCGRLFKQPLVPMVSAEDGSWLLSGPLRPLMKPGGHGVIWKLMLDEGIFDWLSHRDREAAIVRQIRYPA